MAKIKCKKYGPPPIGTTAWIVCDCASCAISTKKDQEKLLEQVTRALIYMQSKENYKLNKKK